MYDSNQTTIGQKEKFFALHNKRLKTKPSAIRFEIAVELLNCNIWPKVKNRYFVILPDWKKDSK